MRTNLASTTVCSLAMLALAACNESRPGANNLIDFTPLECGNLLLGCTFDKSLALWANTDVQIAGIDGYPTAGLTLVSRDPSVLTVNAIPDVGGRPTWDLHAAGEGVATLAAVDADDNEIDFTEVAVRQAQRLSLVRVLGNAVGPTQVGAVQEWTVTAEQPVSFQARMIVDESAELIGRIGYTTTFPEGSRLLASEIGGSDREKGYLYVSPPAGVHTFSFELAVAPDVKIEAALRAQ